MKKEENAIFIKYVYSFNFRHYHEKKPNNNPTPNLTIFGVGTEDEFQKLKSWDAGKYQRVNHRSYPD